jgi:hypothetical protein
MVSVRRKIVVERRIAIVRTARLVPQKPLKSPRPVDAISALTSEFILSTVFGTIGANFKLLLNALAHEKSRVRFS